MKKRKKIEEIKENTFCTQEPQLEFVSNRKLIVDCCDSILEYQPETIKLKFRKFNIRIFGQDLLLCNLNGQSIMITGTIHNVDFTE